ncbi:hypothetical protein [Microbacterium sp. 2RAF4]|uniref:hypothetical protein n=1 Tax=Microbacterium sp. 2RAF4 TaxID=3232999 RepID=UPI003F9D3E06
MATTKTPPAPTPEYDFDSWNDDVEEKAIESLKPDVRYIIVEKKFVGRFVDGSIVEIPFNLSVDDINELEQVAAGDPIEQLKHLLTKLGGKEVAASFTRHNIAETMTLATKYFTILQRIAGASLPE